LPISDSFNQVMFAGIPVDVVSTSFEVVWISNGVFPEARLPDTAFASNPLGFGDLRLRLICSEPLLAESGFDPFHAQRIPLVSIGQLDHQMPMVWQQYRCDDCERMPLANIFNCAAKKCPSCVSRENLPSPIRHCSQEIRPARNKPKPIIRHPRTTPKSRPDRAQRCSGRINQVPTYQIAGAASLRSWIRPTASLRFGTGCRCLLPQLSNGSRRLFPADRWRKAVPDRRFPERPVQLRAVS